MIATIDRATAPAREKAAREAAAGSTGPAKSPAAAAGVDGGAKAESGAHSDARRRRTAFGEGAEGERCWGYGRG